MRRTRVKICGITRPEDGLAAAELGADAIGLVFFPGSSRFVDAGTAAGIVRILPPFISAVGLFVNADPGEVRVVLDRVPLAMLQFHGDEDPNYCAAFGLPFIKAVPMSAAADVEDYARRFAAAAGLLLDSHDQGGIGGSGRRFDWERVPGQSSRPIILAGGLSPDNVAEAVRRVRPYGVDVSSGVEAARGIKDHGLMKAFLRAVKKGENGG